MAGSSIFLSQALGELKGRATFEGLKVDSSATYALEKAFGKALAGARKSEGSDFISPSHIVEFKKTSRIFTDEVLKAALSDHVELVDQSHVEIGILKLQTRGMWPFTGDDE